MEFNPTASPSFNAEAARCHNLGIWCKDLDLGSIWIVLSSGNLLQIMSEEVPCFLIIPLAELPGFM
jgi:hypothetical protein